MDHIIGQAEQPDPEVPPLAFERQYARSWLQQYKICLWCALPCAACCCSTHLQTAADLWFCCYRKFNATFW